MQRIVLRKLASRALEAGWSDLRMGFSESDVCYNLGLPHDLFEGLLLSAIEQVLWERGHMNDRKIAGEKLSVETPRGPSFAGGVRQC